MSEQLPYVNHGFSVVRPYLYGSLAEIDFMERVLGAQILERFVFSSTAFHIEARIGDSVVVLEASDPPHPEGTPASVYVYVPDVDAAYERALAEGATSIEPPEVRPYHERQCGVKDSYGNTWWISTYLPDEP
jgi:PhnB protein